jgi:hypothetical protein
VTVRKPHGIVQCGYGVLLGRKRDSGIGSPLSEGSELRDQLSPDRKHPTNSVIDTAAAASSRKVFMR